MGSYIITSCHPTQANTPRRCYLIYLPRRDGRLSRPRWLVTYRDGLPAHRRSPIQVLTGPDVELVTTLIETKALPLSQASTKHTQCSLTLSVCPSVTRREISINHYPLSPSETQRGKSPVIKKPRLCWMNVTFSVPFQVRWNVKRFLYGFYVKVRKLSEGTPSCGKCCRLARMHARHRLDS